MPRELPSINISIYKENGMRYLRDASRDNEAIHDENDRDINWNFFDFFLAIGMKIERVI